MCNEAVANTERVIVYYRVPTHHLHFSTFSVCFPKLQNEKRVKMLYSAEFRHVPRKFVLKLVEFRRKYVRAKLITQNLKNYLLTIKPTRCTNFSSLFCSETLHVSDSSSVHHQELFTVHSAVVYVIQVCRQGTDKDRTAFHRDPARKLSTNLYDMYHC
jgi:hypothetical protein